MKKIIYTEKAPPPIGPYSQAVEINGLLFISGQIPLNPITNEIEKNIESQTKQVMDNIGFILEGAGYSFSNVIKTSIFLKNMNDFGIVNEIYASYFKDKFPARETIEVAKLPKDALVEISAIAANTKYR